MPVVHPTPGSVDIGGVQDMLESMGLSVPSRADKLMSDIEHQQKQVVFARQILMFLPFSLRFLT